MKWQCLPKNGILVNCLPIQRSRHRPDSKSGLKIIVKILPKTGKKYSL